MSKETVSTVEFLRVAKTVALAWVFVACGSNSASGDANWDAGWDAAVGDDALIDGDAQFADYEWERVVTAEDAPDVHAVVSVATGVAVIAEPELVLYDSDGRENGRTQWPPYTPERGGWTYRHSIARASGDVAVLFEDAFQAFVVQEYRGGDLSESTRTELGIALWGVLAELDGLLYVLVRSGSSEVVLHRLGDGSIADSKVVSSARHTVRPGSAVTPAGQLAFCSVVPDSTTEAVPRVLRVDPSTGESSELLLASPCNAALGSCVLVPGRDSMLALWFEYLEGRNLYRWRLVSPEGTDFRSEVMDGTEIRLDLPHIAYDAGEFLGIGPTYGDQVALYAIDGESGAMLPRWLVRLRASEFVTTAMPYYALDSDGIRPYVAVVAHRYLQPMELRLQRLWPLGEAANTSQLP